MRTLLVFCVAAGLVGCGSSTATKPVRRTYEDDAKEAFALAQKFLVAVNANNTAAALEFTDAPFLLGPIASPKRLETRDELASQLTAARDAGGGDDFPKTTVLLTPLRPEEAEPAERSRVEQWLALAGPGGHVMSTGDPLAPGPVKLLLKIRDGRIRVVGLLY